MASLLRRWSRLNKVTCVSTYIDLEDGRSWRAANWAYDSVIEAIADELTASEPERELSAWLRKQTCLTCGPGLGSIDVRQLSPTSRTYFGMAARAAYRKALVQGSTGWQQPEFFSGWISKFDELLRMMDETDRRKTTSSGTQVPASPKRRVGPGWRDSDQPHDDSVPE